MAIEINGKIYRNLQEQVSENMNDIKTLETTVEELDTNVDALTIAVEGKADASSVYTKTESDEKYLEKGASSVETDNVELMAVYSQDVMSRVSLEPTSALIKVISGDNNSTIGLSGTEVDITTGILKYNSKEIATKDYIHQITLYSDGSTLHCYLVFNIRNNVSTPYTTVNQVYTALIAKYGENQFFNGNGYYQVNGGYKEILFNPSTRGSNDYALDADYYEVDANWDSGNESIYLTGFQVKDIIL